VLRRLQRRSRRRRPWRRRRWWAPLRSSLRSLQTYAAWVAESLHRQRLQRDARSVLAVRRGYDGPFTLRSVGLGTLSHLLRPIEFEGDILMNIPSFSAQAALYRSKARYFAGSSGAVAGQLGLSQLTFPALLRTPIICNGNCPPPICHFHCGPCTADSSVPSGCSRQCCSFGPGCEDPGCSTVDCPASACCPVTCSGASCSCGSYPNCQPTGMKTCTDCHGNPAPPQPC